VEVFRPPLDEQNMTQPYTHIVWYRHVILKAYGNMPQIFRGITFRLDSLSNDSYAHASCYSHITFLRWRWRRCLCLWWPMSLQKRLQPVSKLLQLRFTHCHRGRLNRLSGLGRLLDFILVGQGYIAMVAGVPAKDKAPRRIFVVSPRK
jgi:hypothetical protein